MNGSNVSFYGGHTYTVGGSVGTAGTPITSALYLFDDEAYAREWGAKNEAFKGGGLKILQCEFDDVTDRPDTQRVSALWVEHDIYGSTAQLWRVARLDVISDIT